MQATAKIKGYDTFEQIALGGMATVYRARKVSIDKPVAIKVLYPHLAQDAVYIERFKREARSAARVQHDNIVNVIDFGESDDSYYIVMEYYDGATLGDLLETHPVVPPDICFGVILNVCYGLEAAHAAHVVHRDIKPANIIFTRSGGIKLADFGLARAVDKLKSVTQHGKVIGTPAYMSPEQTRGDEVGTQSDIFSLGVVAYELACGQRPFDGRNYAEVVDCIQSAEPEPVTELNPLVGKSFSNAIGRMLGKAPDQRYAHIAEAVLDLEEAMDKAGYRRDRRTLSRYIDNPSEYLAEFNRAQLDKLRSNPPSEEDGPEAVLLHYRRVLFLDPSDAEAKARLSESQAKEVTSEQKPRKAAAEADAPKSAQYDPDADYKVYLESIDLNRESPETFALKLSMRIRSPLPRVMTIVKNMPTVVGGRLPIRRAKKLAKVIDQLGGVARIELHPIDESTGSQSAVKKDAGAGANRASRSQPPKAHGRTPDSGAVGEERPPRPDPGLDVTVEHHPINDGASGRREDTPDAARSTRKCPKCGWDEDADAKFCSICLFSFNKTEQLDLASLQGGPRIPNPLADESPRATRRPNLPDWFHELPNNVKYGGLAAIIILLLLILFGR
jgi:serine/threonine protein kinase